MTERAETIDTEDEKNEDEKKGGLFEDLSIAQVVAGALAAVTALLLSSKIGIAGSVIGVALASVVSTVTSQLYKKFLSTSAKKIKSGIQAQTTVRGKHSAGAISDPDATTVLASESDVTTVLSDKADGLDATALLDSSRTVSSVSHDDKPTGPDHQRKLQLAVIIVSVVSALVVVVLCAVIINLSTQGEGIGHKPQPIFAASEEVATDASTEAQATAESEQSTQATTPAADATAADAAQSDAAQNAEQTSGAADASGTAATDNATAGTDTGAGGTTPTDTGDSSQSETGGATGGETSDTGSEPTTSQTGA